MIRLTRRCSTPAASDTRGYAAQLSAAGLLSGRGVSQTERGTIHGSTP
jgi:hypothetical protein